MERLTFDGNFCDIALCSEVRYGSFCEDGSCSQRRVWERLKQYEDTGLEPEEVEQIKRAAVYMMFEDVAHFVRYTLSNFDELQKYKALGDYNRLRELKQADDEGRCVVLPFKPPRWVDMCSARFPKPAKAHYASAINVLQDMDSGCVFGDTPKEAEDALRREQEKEKEDEHETS